MTPEETRIADALSKVSSVATCRVLRNISEYYGPDKPLTPKLHRRLYAVAYIFRDRLPEDIAKIAIESIT